MRYLLINPQGQMYERDCVTYTEALDQVGPEGWAQVRLAPNLTAYINDCALILPEKYQPNMLGGLLLMLLGAAHQPYPGTIVITGWDPGATIRDEIEVIDLTLLQVAVIGGIYAWATAMLAFPDKKRPRDILTYQELVDLVEIAHPGTVPGDHRSEKEAKSNDHDR